MSKFSNDTIFCKTVETSCIDIDKLIDTSLDTELYLVNLSFYKKFVNQFKRFLSIEEYNRAKRYFNEADRDRFIICRVILKLLLSKRTGLKILEVFFHTNVHKKPFLLGHENLYFNVSHAGNFAIVGIAKKAIGVDIEYVNKDFDYNEILPTIFNTSEIEEITNSLDKHKTFYLLWTRKEAIVKATGKGIDDNFLKIPSQDGYHHIDSELLGELKSMQVISFQLNEGYIASVATSETIEQTDKLLIYNILPQAFQEYFNGI